MFFSEVQNGCNFLHDGCQSKYTSTSAEMQVCFGCTCVLRRVKGVGKQQDFAKRQSGPLSRRCKVGPVEIDADLTDCHRISKQAVRASVALSAWRYVSCFLFVKQHLHWSERPKLFCVLKTFK